ncbi:hypothetical protein [Pusillimonas noertemannii]|uniref:Uncharacterized protein n=1 Tax=Pusillimonas noertemannii TaxID=305977 RepID=A0A2U1CRW9_9BURK|nr:hypothetical protein [Pusillimonas noertemannii]NYT67962.1 hypothetical protein [Pusillimonas noertemannii]PVY68636.1 hypothetical protein C7440_1047 [Pusillimonas noertemannii]TFL11896.1 hypothetical protein CSC72_01840 [Pusillimonas noertemannii]
MNIRHYLKQLALDLPARNGIDKSVFILARLFTPRSRWLSTDLRMAMNLVFAKSKLRALALTVLGRDAVIG